MTDKRTTDENTRTPIDGSEFIRLATPGANWKATVRDILNTSGYTLASTNVDFYVDGATGNDNNSGLSSAVPFATIQRAADVAAQYNWQQLYKPMIHVSDGTYSISSPIILPSLYNAKQFPGTTFPGLLMGNSSVPANCIITGVGFTVPDVIIVDGGTLPAADGASLWEIFGFRLIPFNGGCITARNGGCYWIDALEFGSTSGAIEFALGAWGDGNLLGGASAGPLTLTTTLNSTTINSYYQCVDGYLELGGFTHTLPSTTITMNTGFISGSGGAALVVYDTNVYTNSSNLTGAKFTLYGNSNLAGNLSRSEIPGSVRGTKDPTAVIVADLQYVVVTPSTGDTVNSSAGQHAVIINSSATLASLTVNLPSEMCEQEIFRISTSNALTSLTIGSTDGSNVVGAPATLAAGSAIQFIFEAASTTWYIS